jgi:hypothetical protein
MSNGGYDLNGYRLLKGWSNRELTLAMGFSQKAEALVAKYALGKRWPPPHVIDRVIEVSKGQITVAAMHRRYAEMQKGNRKYGGRPELGMPLEMA